MFKKILVPLDGGEIGDAILRQLSPFLSSGSHAELFRVYRDAREREAATADLEERSQRLQATGAVVSHALAQGDPAAAILERAAATKPDLVALASHGRRGPARWIRGSVAERVLRHCSVPLLIAHPSEAAGPPSAFSRVLVPLDGSPRALAILPLATALARAFGAEIVLMRASNAHHVTLGELVSPVEGRTPSPTTTTQLEKSLAPARDLVAAEGVRVRCVTAFGDPAGEILRAADEEGIDLIAISTHGRTGVGRWLFGSVAENVLRAWRLPVLVLRDPPPARGGAPVAPRAAEAHHTGGGREGSG